MRRWTIAMALVFGMCAVVPTGAEVNHDGEQRTEDAISFARKVNHSWRDNAITQSDDTNLFSREMIDILDGTDDMVMPDNGNNTEFCRGMYMTMFMDGFHWTILKKPPSMQCLNFFVRSWRLENAGKFKGAMLFTFLLAVLVEGLSSARVNVVHNMANRKRQHALLTVIYGLQAMLGFILMLVTMSFSIELVLSVIGGLVTGNLLFMRYDEEVAEPLASRSSHNLQQQGTLDEHIEARPLLAGANTLRRRG